MGVVKAAIADGVLTFMWVFCSATLGIFTFLISSAFGITQGIPTLFITTFLLFVLFFVFGIIGDLLGGAAFNPAGTAAFYAAGVTKDSLFTVATRFPAQAAGAVAGALAILEVIPTQYKHMLGGPSLKVDLHNGAIAEGILTFIMTFLVFLIVLKGPANPFLKNWLLAMSTVTMAVTGAKYTGPFMNPANEVMALRFFTELLDSLSHAICKGEDKNLPDTFGRLPECLILDILSRLPIDCLLSSRRVSREWRALISSSQYFTTLHLDRARPMLFLQDHFSTTKHGQNLYVFGENDRHNKKKGFKKVRLRPELMLNMSRISLVYSCQGVLLFADFRWLSTYYVFNPVTQEEVTVRHTLYPGYLCAFYFCPLTREFKILYVKARGIWCQYFVYTFKTKTWRETRSPSTFKYFPTAANPAVVNGALHWVTNNDLENRRSPPCENGIMAFRMDTEDFFAMPHPGSVCNSKRLHETMTLFAKDDCLAFCHVLISEYAVDIWILEDYEMRAWIKKYKVNLFDWRIFPFRLRYYNAMETIKVMSPGWWIELLNIQDGELLFKLSDEGLLSYNLDHKTAKRIELPQRKMFLYTCKPYIKSVLAIAN